MPQQLIDSEMYEYKLYVLDRAQVITHVSQ